MIAIITTMKAEKTKQALQIYVAPANHNWLQESYTLQVVNTLLGNSYQDKHNPTVQNQDMGIDACVLVGYNTDDNKPPKA